MILSVLYILLSGIALPMGGIQMQKMWHNQLGDVYSVGLGSAACLGGALAAMIGWSIPVGAYLICLLAAILGALFYVFLNNTRFITFGMLFGSLIGSFGTIVANNTTPENLQLYYRWAGCSFKVSGYHPYIYYLSFLLFAIGLFSAWQFVRHKRHSNVYYFLNLNLLVISVIAVCGIVGMISLTVPNLVRIIFKNCSLWKESLWSILISTVLLAITFVITEFSKGFYLPISATMSIIAFPMVVFLMKSEKDHPSQ